MKKIVLSLAGALAATAFAPEASAVPSFARQVGMACNACHFQHFPVLNSFGQAFKAAGYTMMGAQDKVEGEHLSIPAVLNASVLVKMRYQKTNGVDTAASAAVPGTSTNSGQWQIPDEMSLFLGGRAAENVGFLVEGNLTGNNTAGAGAVKKGAQQGNGGIAAALKVPFMFDAGGAKLGVIPFWTDAGGMAQGYELSSSAMVRGLRWAEERSTISAAGFLGMNSGAVTGFAFVAKNDMGYINLTRYSPTLAGASGKRMKSNWLRLAATPTYADWNMHIGLGIASGSDTNALAVVTDRKGSTLDFQGQTQLGGKDFSLYASYARAPGTSAAVGATANAFNGNPNTAKAYQIGADYSVIPHTLSLGASYLNGDNGAATFNKDKGVMVQAIYDFTQNVAFHASYTKYSGSAYDVGGGKDRTVAGNTGDSLMNLMLEASF